MREVNAMLSCQDAEPLLQDYLEGYLLPTQREVLDGHLRTCARCADLAARLGRLDRCLGEVSDLDVPEGLSRSILAAIPEQTYRQAPLRRALLWGAAPVLALALVAFAFVLRGRLVPGGHRIAAREVEVALTAPQATSVAVVGDFNGWNPNHTRLQRVAEEGVWRARLKLPPGVYQYSFVLDSKTWVSDPGAKTVLADGFGGSNSVIIVEGSEI